jgi:hypothetical protein
VADSTRVFIPGARALLSFCAVLTSLACAGDAIAQEARSWRGSLELGSSAGATWLDGGESPKVRTQMGVFGGAGVQRAISPRFAAGVGIRVMTAAVELSEAGESWKGGRLLETNLLATASLHRGTTSLVRASLDVAAGVANLSGAGTIVPFSGASSISPVGEAGVSLRRGTAAVTPRREAAVFVRYRLVRLRATHRELAATVGAASSVLAGVSVTR